MADSVATAGRPSEQARGRLWRIAQLAALALLLVGCTPEPSSGHGHPHPEPAQLAEAERRAEHIGATQRRAGSEYAFVAIDGRQSAHNRAQQWRLTMNRRGIEIEPSDPLASWSLGLRLIALGRGEIRAALAEASVVQAEGNRVRLQHGRAIESWYLNGPLGLEHGLVLDEPWEMPRGDGPLTAVFELTGSLVPTGGDSHGPIVLRDARGRAVAHYGELFVRDREGTPLASRLELHGRLVRLVIDDRGARYPLHVDPLVWGQSQKVGSSDDTVRYFGAAVAISGDAAIVGAAPPPFGSSPSCAAHIFARGGLQWTEQQILLSSTAVGCRLGSAVAISGDAAIVGEPARDQVGTAGMAYVFVRNAAAWSQEHVANGETDWDQFGWSVSLDGDTALIGAAGDDDGAVNDTGSAYVLVRSAAAWTQQAKLLASDRVAADRLGSALAVSGNTALVGAVGADGNAIDSGAVYAFTRSGSTWTERDKLFASDGGSDDGFGGAISLDGDRVIIGASSAEGVDVGHGAAYVFVRNALVWTEQDKLFSLGGDPGAHFGCAVSLSGDAALVGSKHDDGGGMIAGAAYEYVRSASVWIEQQEILANDGNLSDEFGTAVARSADWLWIGAPLHDGQAPDEGAAYVFRYALSPGSTCTLGVECTTGHCVEGLCCDLPCSGPCEACDLPGGEGHCEPRPAGSAGDPSCAPYLCDGGSESCPQACFADGHCASTHYCEAAACVARRALGASCIEGRECEADYCVEGVCCDRECAGGCESCLESLQGGGSDGTCGPVRAGDDPWDRCAEHAGFPASCLADGACDGQGSCRTLAPVGTSCGEGSCVDELLVPAVCDGSGECVTDPSLSSEDCSPFLCAEPGLCPTSCSSSADCVSGHICDWQSQCVTPPARSTAEGGCSVAAQGDRRRRGAPALLLGLLALCRSARRRSARRSSRAGARLARRRTLLVVLATLLVGCGPERTAGQDAGELSHPSAVDHAVTATSAPPSQTGLDASTEAARQPLDSRALEWVEQSKLSASNGVGQAGFGWGVALSGDSAFVGAPNDGAQGAAAGAAYAFVRAAGTWTQQQKLLASDGAADLRFGTSVALDGDTALVGAPQRDQGMAGTGPGAVYEFARSAGTWTERDKLTAAGGAVDDGFGWSIALEGDTALIGALSDDEQGLDSGSAYVFTRSASTWTEQQQLTADDGSTLAYFGFSVALSGDVAIIGAPYDDDACAGQNPAAYVFTRSASSFVQEQKLFGPAASPTGFGLAVAASGDTVLVGDPCIDNLQGRATAYLRNGSSWGQPEALTASNPGSMDVFGVAVALEGDTALVGAFFNDDLGQHAGSAYQFTRSAADWTEDHKLLASDGAAQDEFGNAVALATDTALVAAYRDDDQEGSVYVFYRALDLASPCAVGSECLSGNCSDGFCCDSPCAGACDTCAVTGHQGTCRLLVPGAVGEEGCVYRCDGLSGECPTSCGDHGDCVSTHQCEGDLCVARPLGGPCADESECDTGYCVDGVCCDDPCVSPCEVCVASLKTSGADGRCGPVPVGTDPLDGCNPDPDGPSSCGGDGLCDGQGRCRSTAPVGTPCEASPCDGPRILTSSCDQAGDCVAETSVDCSPYLCALPGECRTDCASSADCVGGLICDWQSRCVVPPAASEAGGGCGCRTVRRSTPRDVGVWAALLGALLLGRPGRQRRASRRGATSG